MLLGRCSSYVLMHGPAYEKFANSAQGPLSEVYGRVRVVQLSNAFFLAWNIGCGFAQNSGQMMAFRFLSGLGGSAPLAIGGGVLSDVWPGAHEQSRGIANWTAECGADRDGVCVLVVAHGIAVVGHWVSCRVGLGAVVPVWRGRQRVDGSASPEL